MEKSIMAISLSESIHIGFTDILTRKVRSVVTIIGIVLGVMSIMVVLAIVNGMNDSTLRWMQERGGLNKIEVERNWEYDFRKGGKAYFSLNEIKLIRNLIPEAGVFNAEISEYQVNLKRASKDYWGSLHGVMPDMTEIEAWNVSRGRFLNRYDIDLSQNVIVLGSTVARELFDSRNPLGEYVTVKGQQMMVIGIMETKFFEAQAGNRAWGDNAMEYLNRRSFIPISTMMHKISPHLNISGFQVKTNGEAKTSELRKKVENIVLNL
ncbi:MAG: ABC transporter permease, partial [Candidatus Cloacimonadaceae bacterium]|nr:ABC transporter permease [Candidatus Cloacimonadaceae bacterium]